ncbi:unnamed protein product [Pseudo-nitzschia multistriata]|uniref:Mediator of RNA polymerase II transcription subunit 21 n=1 Tax=Pseudo-nitzschia multistriata TaxID=183589 RepID=A0A448YYG1_9STRA|nr:unnamed protein product [Pseudo-nitzschia multistriata]
MATVQPEATGPPEPPNAAADNDHQKVDRITSLQEGIDGLSLSLFEALRGLRDAVAPESGNLGGVQQQQQAQASNAGETNGNKNSGNSESPNGSPEDDFEEFCLAYQNRDPDTLALVQKHAKGVPTREKDFRLIHERIREEKDADLVRAVAATVLEKSADIDRRVSELPGMHRTRKEQLERIEELIEKNKDTAARLEDAYRRAEHQRTKVRAFVRDHTCRSLGIIED